MSFLDNGNKKKDGFHVVVEVLDSSIDFSVILIKGKNYGELANVSVKHRILPENGLTEIEVNKIGLYGGIQDQIAASFGGFNAITLSDKIEVNPFDRKYIEGWKFL